MPHSETYRVFVTGDREDMPSRFPAKHSKNGRPIQWHSLPLLRFTPLSVDPLLIRSLKEESVDWLIFTSSRAVQFFSELLQELAIEMPVETQVATIGEQTARVAASMGFEVDFFPTEPGTEKFLEEFESLLSNNTVKPSVFIPMAESGRATLRERLQQLGCDVRWVFLYRTLPREDLEAHQPEGLSQADLVVFTSPSSVEIFLKHFALPVQARVAALGRFTAAALERCGIKDWSLLPEGDLTRIDEVLP